MTAHIQDLLAKSMEHSPFWEDNSSAASEEIPPHFVEPEGSLPPSQAPTTCPYPEPEQTPRGIKR